MTTPEIYRWRIRSPLDAHPCECCAAPLAIGDDAVQIDGVIYCPECAPDVLRARAEYTDDPRPAGQLIMFTTTTTTGKLF